MPPSGLVELAISIPRTEAAVIRHFQAKKPKESSFCVRIILGQSHQNAERLSDCQLARVCRAAALLQPNARSQFLQSIAHELADVDAVDDDAVQWAVDAIMDAAARR
jgi:hypothetical protein